MATILTVSNRDRGFARLGPDNDPYLRGIRTVMEQRGYESESQGGDIWMRDQPRRLGGFPLPYTQPLATCHSSAAGGWNVAWTASLDPRYDQVGQVADLQQCRQMLANAATDPDHRFLYWLDATLCFVSGRIERRSFSRTSCPPSADAFPLVE